MAKAFDDDENFQSINYLSVIVSKKIISLCKHEHVKKTKKYVEKQELL